MNRLACSLVLAALPLACAGNPTEAMTLGSSASATDSSTDPSASSGPESGPSTDDDTQGTTDTGDPFADCGNNIIEGMEQCDNGDANGTGGPCRDNCIVNVCGDGYVGPAEGCDDGNQIPDDGCTDCAGASCGNGDIDAAEGEECDDANDVDGDGCTNCQLPECGDGFLDTTEECEFMMPVELECSDINMMFDAGMLQCTRMCQLSTSACSDCGDGIASGAEECDGNDLGGDTCMSGGFVGGVLVCDAATCTLDSSGCTTCGDDMIDAGEACDGMDLGGQTCESLLQGPGVLACNACQFDFSGCSSCGNNAVDDGEDCDGAMLPQTMCSQLPAQYDQGMLACVGCAYQTDQCCYDDPGDACPGGDAECCGALECDDDDGVCCTSVLGTSCTNDGECCGADDCNVSEGSVCCTDRLGDACAEDNECCAAIATARTTCAAPTW
jgi:cysteine-rich repeat protein